MKYTIEVLIGNEGKKYLDLVSKMRVEAYKGYPYLYITNEAYEKNYITGYLTHNQAMVAVARVDNKIAGVSTGIPLVSDFEIVKNATEIFATLNMNARDYYYYGDLIVLPEFREQGIVTKLFSAQEKLIKEWGYKYICTLTVARENNHPLKPAKYQSPDKKGEHIGFTKIPLTTEYYWPTLQPDGSVIECTNVLDFWVKPLE